jgi:hypothetical protein
MLRTFDFAVKGAANKSAQGIALWGVGIAVGVTGRPRGARRGSPDHCGEDLRQVQHPGKTAFSAELSRFFMACPGKCLPKELILQPSEFEKSLVFKRDFDFLKMFTAVVSGPLNTSFRATEQGGAARSV